MANTTKQLAIKLARELRKRQTKAELLFWEAVRNKKLNGWKFRRQEPIFYKYNGKLKFFISDFVCFDLKLIVEIDGGIHENQKDYDQLREEILKIKNFKILRFKNEEISDNLEKVLEKIKTVKIEK